VCRADWQAEWDASRPPKPYSTDLNAAYAAAEKVGLLGELRYFIGQYSESSQFVGFWIKRFQDRPIAEHESLAVTICMAILKLKETK
jgi:hypothetical protein